MNRRCERRKTEHIFEKKSYKIINRCWVWKMPIFPFLIACFFVTTSIYAKLSFLCEELKVFEIFIHFFIYYFQNLPKKDIMSLQSTQLYLLSTAYFTIIHIHIIYKLHQIVLNNLFFEQICMQYLQKKDLNSWANQRNADKYAKLSTFSSCVSQYKDVDVCKERFHCYETFNLSFYLKIENFSGN